MDNKRAIAQPVLDKLKRVRTSGDGWAAICPAHDDSSPSMTVGVGDTGRILLNCHRGCSFDDIVQALGMSPEDLFPEKEKASKSDKEFYSYYDANGDLVFQVVRSVTKEGRKDFRQRRPDGAGGWIWTATGIEKPLYRLPNVLAAVNEGTPIWIAEGEKDVEALESRGIVATCNPGGAGKWLPNHTAALKGAKVTITVDKDTPGLRHALKVVDALEGVAESIRVVEPPVGKDAADSIALGVSPVGFTEINLTEKLGDHDPFRLLVNELREIGNEDIDFEKKINRARITLERSLTSESPDNFGRLSKWETFLAGPVESYDWVIPDLVEKGERVIVVAGEGVGKRLCLKTKVPTPDGWTTMGDIQEGDLVLDRFGKPCSVTWVGPIEDNPDAYRVWLSDGNYLDADAEHQWYTEDIVEREQRLPGKVRTTQEIGDTLLSGRANGALNHAIPTTLPLELPDALLPLDPYTLGVWLGDGSAGTVSIADDEILSEIPMESRELSSGYELVGLEPILKEAGLLDNKHIPMSYLRGSYAQRLALVQGLMDSDGTVNAAGACEFAVTDKTLAEGFHELILTMGIKATMLTHPATVNGQHVSDRYRIHFKTDLPVARLPRKAHRLPKRLATKRSLYRYITDVEKIDPVPMRCITVDSPDHTYLAGSFIPTHNTMLARQMALMTAAGLHPFTKTRIPKKRTLFVDLENPEKIIRRTSKKILDAVRLVTQSSQPIDAHLLVKPDGMDLLNAADLMELEKVIEQTEPDIVFLGPLYKSYVETGSDNMRVIKQVVMTLDYLRDTYDVAWWLEHHAPLGSGSDRTLRPVDSGVWSRWPEFGLALQPDPTMPGTFDLKHFRGQRDKRNWPSALVRGNEFPFDAIY